MRITDAVTALEQLLTEVFVGAVFALALIYLCQVASRGKK